MRCNASHLNVGSAACWLRVALDGISRPPKVFRQRQGAPLCVARDLGRMGQPRHGGDDEGVVNDDSVLRYRVRDHAHYDQWHVHKRQK